MFILMLIAVYGILGELSNPGAILPGVLGAIALVLVLYMAAILPVNVAGLALIGLAMALFIADVFAPTHGDSDGGRDRRIFARIADVLRPRGTGLPAFALIHHSRDGRHGALLYVCRRRGLRAQLLPVQGRPRDDARARPSTTITRIDSSGGKVFIEGEYWNAMSEPPIEQGQPVEMTAVQGLTLKVKPKAADLISYSLTNGPTHATAS